MSFLHMSRSVSVVRAYREPDGYARRLEYHAIVTVKHMNSTTVYLEECVGELDPDDFPDLLAMLKEQGVKTVFYERHSRMKTRNL